jgi:hypothetical protein
MEWKGVAPPISETYRLVENWGQLGWGGGGFGGCCADMDELHTEEGILCGGGEGIGFWLEPAPSVADLWERFG